MLFSLFEWLDEAGRDICETYEERLQVLEYAVGAGVQQKNPPRRYESGHQGDHRKGKQHTPTGGEPDPPTTQTDPPTRRSGIRPRIRSRFLTPRRMGSTRLSRQAYRPHTRTCF